MTQSYLILLTRRTDAENALIRVLDIAGHPTDSLDHACLFTSRAAAENIVRHWDDWITATGGRDSELNAWHPTIAPAGESTGVPGQPGTSPTSPTSPVGPETDAANEMTKPAERLDVARLGGKAKQHRGTAKS